jgi:intraflagellar transport protein 56
LGDYEKALDIFRQIPDSEDKSGSNHLNIACCLYFLGIYKEALEETMKGPSNALQRRLRYHLAEKLGDEETLQELHSKLLVGSIEDRLSVAAMHGIKNQREDASNIYKKILVENSSYIALNIYLALCYYKLDFYDISLEVLNAYLQKFPGSHIALNLKACNQYKLYNSKDALQVLQPLTDTIEIDNPLIQHNTVVFKGGENALQILPSLTGMIPEAKLNIVIHHLKNGEYNEAYNLINDLEPVHTTEFILKAVANVCYGQQNDSRECLKLAQQYFQLVGSNQNDCDTIPGRQCMASCLFIIKRFHEVNTYLSSIKQFCLNDDDFNWNFGISLAAEGQYKQAEECLTSIQNDSYKQDHMYSMWLARCYIMNGKAEKAWELYLKMDTSAETLNLLQLIANDCYRVGSYYFSAKAFDVLERLDPSPEYWEGKRGACVGVFQQVIARKEQPSVLHDIVQLLSNTHSPQVDYICSTIAKWAKESGTYLR